MKPKVGAHISFSYKQEQLTGTILNDEKGKLVIKLDTGYNMSVEQSELKNVQERKVAAKKKQARIKQKPTKGLPRIHLLHTGGTIASRVDYETGAVIAQYTAEEILDLYPELLKVADVKSELVANMQSEMMRFAHWNLLAKGVEKAVREGAQGVIITQGTDILHMTAAALSFALKNVPIPVLLIGSQRSSDRPSSDSVSNLLCGTTFIAKSGFKGVALCMHEGVENDDCVILPGTRTRKMHTSRRDAFKTINDRPYARITYPKLDIIKIRDYPNSEGKLEVEQFNEKLKIGMLQMHPQMFAEEFLTFEKFDGLVLSLLGIGHAPTMATDEHNKENTKIMEAITKLSAKLPLVAAPQTIYGRVNMNVYSPGRQLLKAGVLGQNLDLTPETAFVKLAWLLSNFDKKDVRTLYEKDFRGELVKRTDKDGFE